jgi:CRP/FNR family transcriptional regulator, cyclic AMP receptor protein
VANSSCKNSAILPRLPNALLAQLFRSAARRRLQAGEALFVAGDPGDGCYRLEQGLLKVVITSAQGEERILAMLGPGTIVGELAMIDGLPRSSSIFAVRDCELSFINREEFGECTKQHPEIYRYLANVLAARLRETDEAVAADSFLTVRERLARALIELGELLGEADDAGRVVICHKINQSDLAALAGVARENASRVMGDWKRRKVVTRSGGYYCLNAVETLKRNLDSRRRSRVDHGDFASKSVEARSREPSDICHRRTATAAAIEDRRHR